MTAMTRRATLLSTLAAAATLCACSDPVDLRTQHSTAEWLRTPDTCPADVLPTHWAPIRYLADGCRPRVSSCVASCAAGDGADCYSLALLAQETDEFRETSEALFLRACELGIDSGCTNRAAGMFVEDDEAEDREHSGAACAVRTWQIICDRGDAWACTMFGTNLAVGEYVEQDTDRALVTLRQACVKDESDPACQAARSVIAAFELHPDAQPDVLPPN